MKKWKQSRAKGWSRQITNVHGKGVERGRWFSSLLVTPGRGWKESVLGVSPSLFYHWKHVPSMDIEQLSMMEAINLQLKSGCTSLAKYRQSYLKKETCTLVAQSHVMHKLVLTCSWLILFCHALTCLNMFLIHPLLSI